MGISISIDESTPPPRFAIIELECDVRRDILCRGVARYETTGFVAAHGIAMLEGWLERQAPEGRIWLCPACSGKAGQ